MIEKLFDNTIIFVCEDTARTVVYQPTEKNKNNIVDWIDKNNFTCEGVYTVNENVAHTFDYYFHCTISKDINIIKEVEKTFT